MLKDPAAMKSAMAAASAMGQGGSGPEALEAVEAEGVASHLGFRA